MNNPFFEVFCLMMACEQIGNLLTWEMVTISDLGSITSEGTTYPHQEVWFPNSVSHKLFYICLLDLQKKMNTKVVGNGMDFSVIEGLKKITENPILSSDCQNLKDSAEAYISWLDTEIEIPFCSNTVKQEITLKIKRKDIIDLSANKSKHSLGKLNVNAERITKILQRSNVEIDFMEGLLLLDDFYEQFHEDILIYYTTLIAKMLSDIRNSIFEYLTPVYKNAYTTEDHPTIKNFYTFQIPEGFEEKTCKHFFWNLMNWYGSYKNTPVDIKVSPMWKRF